MSTSLSFVFYGFHSDEHGLSPIFVLPGEVRGSVRVPKDLARDTSILKITLKGQASQSLTSIDSDSSKGVMRTSITLGVSTTGLVEMRNMEQPVRSNGTP